MAVLGPSVAGLLAYFLGNQAAGDATFLPVTFSSLIFENGVYYYHKELMKIEKMESECC
jgi:hypothetical protein